MFPPLMTTPTLRPSPMRPSRSSTAASAAAPAPSARSFVRSSSTTIARERALARDHVVVVERVHVRALALPRDLDGGGVRLVVALAEQQRLGAGALDRGELREGHPLRQHDGRQHAEELRGIRDALPVVAGGRGHHAVHAIVRLFPEQRVESAADLEGPGLLEVLKLQEYLAPGER